MWRQVRRVHVVPRHLGDQPRPQQTPQGGKHQPWYLCSVMSSKSSVRSRSLDSGVTPRRLYQVVLPDPGRPIVSTTKPLGDFTAGCSAGGVASDSGCVSITILGSGFTAVGSAESVTAASATASAAVLGGVSATRAGVASGYVGLKGAGWFAGNSCPLFPVDSESFGPRLGRRLIFSLIHSRNSRISRL